MLVCLFNTVITYILSDRNKDNLLKDFLVLVWDGYASEEDIKYPKYRILNSDSRESLTAFAVLQTLK